MLTSPSPWQSQRISCHVTAYLAGMEAKFIKQLKKKSNKSNAGGHVNGALLKAPVKGGTILCLKAGAQRPMVYGHNGVWWEMSKGW